MKPDYKLVLEKLNLPTALTEYDPVVIGTPPLGIDIEESDIDIACYAPNLTEFETSTSKTFGHLNDFSIQHCTVQDQPTLITTFRHMNWEVEVFCQSIPTKDQWGVRHFYVEKRLLTLAPDLIQIIRQLKRQGLKTEPAFAQALDLKDDPYEAILELNYMSDEELLELTQNVSSK